MLGRPPLCCALLCAVLGRPDGEGLAAADEAGLDAAQRIAKRPQRARQVRTRHAHHHRQVLAPVDLPSPRDSEI